MMPEPRLRENGWNAAGLEPSGPRSSTVDGLASRCKQCGLPAHCGANFEKRERAVKGSCRPATHIPVTESHREVILQQRDDIKTRSVTENSPSPDCGQARQSWPIRPSAHEVVHRLSRWGVARAHACREKRWIRAAKRFVASLRLFAQIDHSTESSKRSM